jgi:murein DD-endopeptidase MepM/ murein hydrolase activator NlpD
MFVAKIGDRGDSPSFSSPHLSVTLDPFDAGLVTGPNIKCGEDSTGSWDKYQNTYRFGSRVSLSAKANPGWEFKWWDDGKTCYINNPLNLTMNGPKKTLTARFSNKSGMRFVSPIHGDIAYSDCPYGGSKFSMVWTGRMYGGADNRRCEGSGGHPGVDITKSSANEKIYSIGKGTVIKRVDSVSRTGFGRYVVIRHDNVNYDGCSDCPKSVYSLYAHLQSIDKNFPKENKTVESDQLIGIMGNSGTKAIHLHFQIQEASWGPTPFWPKYTDSAGKLQPYPTGQNCGPNGKEWCDLYDLNDAQRQEAARNVRNNTINPIWLIENGTYGP